MLNNLPYKPILFSVGGALLTMTALSLARKYLSSWAIVANATDALSLPGGLIASVFYPEGIHTEGGAHGWAYLVVIGNFLSYAAMWYLGYRIIGKIVSRTRQKN